MTWLSAIPCLFLPLKSMVSVERALSLLGLARDFSWGLACPFHCTGSALPFLCLGLVLGFVAGLGFGLFCAWLAVKHFVLPHQPAPSPRKESHRSRLRGYLHEQWPSCCCFGFDHCCPAAHLCHSILGFGSWNSSAWLLHFRFCHLHQGLLYPSGVGGGFWSFVSSWCWGGPSWRSRVHLQVVRDQNSSTSQVTLRLVQNLPSTLGFGQRWLWIPPHHTSVIPISGLWFLIGWSSGRLSKFHFVWTTSLIFVALWVRTTRRPSTRPSRRCVRSRSFVVEPTCLYRRYGDQEGEIEVCRFWRGVFLVGMDPCNRDGQRGGTWIMFFASYHAQAGWYPCCNTFWLSLRRATGGRFWGGLWWCGGAFERFWGSLDGGRWYWADHRQRLREVFRGRGSFWCRSLFTQGVRPAWGGLRVPFWRYHASGPSKGRRCFAHYLGIGLMLRHWAG